MRFSSLHKYRGMRQAIYAKTDVRQHRAILQRIAHRAMLRRGLLPDFSSEVLSDLGRIQTPASMERAQVRNFTVLAFSAIFTLGIDLPKYYFFRRFGL